MSPHPARYAPVREVSSVPTFSLGSAVLVVGHVDRVAAVWSASFFDGGSNRSLSRHSWILHFQAVAFDPSLRFALP
jgi:hypothetical protein